MMPQTPLTIGDALGYPATAHFDKLCRDAGVYIKVNDVPVVRFEQVLLRFAREFPAAPKRAEVGPKDSAEKAP